MTKHKTTRYIDITDQMSGGIGLVIDALLALQKTHPDAVVEVTSEREYGESYEKVYLQYSDEMTAVEIRLRDLQDKQREWQRLSADRSAFERNGQPFPAQGRLDELQKELGRGAGHMATLGIYNDDVIVYDHFNGGFRLNGEVVFEFLSAHTARIYGNASETQTEPDAGAGDVGPSDGQ